MLAHGALVDAALYAGAAVDVWARVVVFNASLALVVGLTRDTV